MVYDINVEVPESTVKFDTIGGSITTSNSNTWPYTDNFTWPTYTYYTTYPSTIYKYQLICPRCKTTNWGELDQIITCSGRTGRKFCKANLRAVSKSVDFDIPVGV